MGLTKKYLSAQEQKDKPSSKDGLAAVALHPSTGRTTVSGGLVATHSATGIGSTVPSDPAMWSTGVRTDTPSFCSPSLTSGETGINLNFRRLIGLKLLLKDHLGIFPDLPYKNHI